MLLHCRSFALRRSREKNLCHPHPCQYPESLSSELFRCLLALVIMCRFHRHVTIQFIKNISPSCSGGTSAVDGFGHAARVPGPGFNVALPATYSRSGIFCIGLLPVSVTDMCLIHHMVPFAAVQLVLY